MVIITYDVSTQTTNGQARLRRVSKTCQDYGQRVQNSVFECILDATQLTILKQKLLKIIDDETDSLRIYQLGNSYKHKIEHFGIKSSIDLEGPIIF